MRELIFVAATASDGGHGSLSDACVEGTANVVNLRGHVTGKAVTVLNASAVFGDGVRQYAPRDDDLMKATTALRGLVVVGSAMALVSLTVRLVDLFLTEFVGRKKLENARRDLCTASLLVVDWLLESLGSRFQDEAGHLGIIFTVLKDCWNAADGLEQYVLHSYVPRVNRAKDLDTIVSNVNP